MSKKSRKSSERRDRRKAKAGGFVRPGRSNPRRIGHGGSGEVQALTGDKVDVKGEVDLLELKHQSEERVPGIKLEDVCDGLEGLKAVQEFEKEIEVPKDSFADAMLEAEELEENFE